jgi:hypothetical protein
MLPFLSEEILPMIGVMILRFGAPIMIILLIGSLAQRFEQLRQA